MRPTVAWKEAGSSSQAYGQVPAGQADHALKGSRGHSSRLLMPQKSCGEGQTAPLDWSSSTGSPLVDRHGAAQCGAGTILLHTIPT